MSRCGNDNWSELDNLGTQEDIDHAKDIIGASTDN